MPTKRKSIQKSETVTRTCMSCGKNFEFKGNDLLLSTTQAMVDHYQKQHPDRMAKCFDDYGQTWNAQYDTCLKALHNTTAKMNEAIKQRDDVAAQQRSLAAKLNAIVLVLRTDS